MVGLTSPSGKFLIGMSPVAYAERIGIPQTAASDSASSEALEKRLDTSRESARSIQASKLGGSPCTIVEGTGIGAVHTLTKTSPTDSPSNGRLPTTQRKAM